MNYPNLNDQIFKDSAKTYFINAGTQTLSNNQIFETVGPTSTLRYPINGNTIIFDGVYVKSNHFNFWNTVSPYLPQGCFISHAYVSPESQARIGIEMYVKNYPTLKLTSLIATAGSEPNPELIGKYQNIYLFQIEYSKIKSALANKGINWALPNTTVHQRGLALDITFKVEYENIFVNILQWFYSNNKIELGLSGVFIKQSPTEIHIEFVQDSSNITSFVGDSYFMVNGVNSPVSQFLSEKDGRFYEILKQNGHYDLIDTAYNKTSLSKMPTSAKKQNSMLATAIREILDDALGGPGGIISTLVQSQLDYSQGIINGLLGAVSVISDELDNLTEGRASILIKEAIESEIQKTSDITLIRNKTLSLSPITQNDAKVLMVKESPTSTSNKTTIRNSRITTGDANRAISKLDPKNTPKNTEPTYDNLRIPNGIIETASLTYDHFNDINTEFVINLEKTISFNYKTTVNNVITSIVKHNLNSTIVKAYAIDINGNSVIFSQTTVDVNNISINFNNPFSGTIEVY